jgi:hypothetical protein
MAALALLVIVGIPKLASAQLPPAQSSVTAAVGAVNFDVDGTGTTAGVSGRAAAAITSALAIEANMFWAKPDQQFGDSQMWAFDAQLQYHWRAGRVRPFAGGGVGLFVNKGDFFTDKALTLSGAGGVHVDIGDRVAALGEFRLRGIEVDFAGSLAEVWGGLTIRLGQ